MVDIHAHALIKAFFQVLVQGLVLARDDGPAAAGAHLVNELGYGQRGEMAAQADKHLDSQLFHPAEEFGYALFLQEVGNLVCHPFGVVGAKALVNQAA